MARRRKVRLIRSRTTKNVLIGAFFVFIGLAAVIDRVALDGFRQTLRYAIWASDDKKYFHQNAFLVCQTIDGDTLDIATPTAKNPTARVRLLGVDTPETKHPQKGQMYFGPEAETFTRQLADQQTVVILLDKSDNERDRYGRLLAYVVLPDGQILNERLIAEGYGYADLRFRHSQFDRYRDLMLTAIKDKKGLWKDVQPSQMPDWLVKQMPEIKRLLKNR